ncbi:MAG: dihydrofolate reductase family protein [Dermatophilaceae bacterium]
MRLLLADPPVSSGLPLGSHLDLRALGEAYAVPPASRTWLRVNMVSTLDGAATGADGVTGSINTEADHAVFGLLRAMSDVLLIGAGTARAEGYSPIRLTGELARLRAEMGRPSVLPIVVVTRSGALPPVLREHDPRTSVLAVTCVDSPGIAGLRADLGSEHVIAAGEQDVDLPEAIRELHDRGWPQVHSEGGPHLLGELLAEDLVDELDITYSPLIVGGTHRRITVTGDQVRDFQPRLLVEQDGTLMGRWLRTRPSAAAG